jgi:hemolysin activation/secretion protein
MALAFNNIYDSRVFTATVLAFSVFIVATSAHAQVPVGPTQNNPNQQLPRPIPEVTPPPSVQESTPALKPELFEAGPRFIINKITFDGALPNEGAMLEDAYSSQKGRIISLGDLRAIALDVERRLQANGYRFTRVLVPEQEILNGNVKLQIVRGFISSIQVIGGSEKARQAVERAIAPLADGRLWRDGDAERFILLAREVPGSDVRTIVRRGTGALGAVDLLVEITDHRLNAISSINNLGAKALGPTAGFFQVAINNVIGQADMTRFGAYASLDGDKQRIVQFSHNSALGSSGLRGSLSLGQTTAKPGGEAAILDLEARVTNARVELTYPLILRRVRRVDIGVGLDWIDQSTDVFGGNARLVEESLRVVFGRLEFKHDFATQRAERILSSLETRAGFVGSVWGELEVRQGVDTLNASSADERLLSRSGATPQALLMRFDSNLDLRLPRQLTMRLRMLGQTSRDVVTSFEEFSVGGFTIGRGYDPSSLTGSQGVGASSEVALRSFPLRRRESEFGRYQPFAFVDWGRVWNSSDSSLSRRDSASIGVGVRVDFNRKANLEFVYARPIHGLVPGEKPPAPRVTINLAIRRDWLKK